MRNKAAEKAKHVHHQQQAQQCQQGTGVSTGNSGGANGGSNGTVAGSGGSAVSIGEITGNVSVITHSGAVHSQQQHPSQTQLTPGNGSGEQRSGGYSINGILGIQHTDPNGNSIKRKRIDGMLFS